MNSARILPLEPPYSASVQADFDTVMRGAPPLRLFRTVARNPRVLSRMIAGGLLDKGSISVRARELMILRTTARCGAEYEWGVHVAVFAAKAGLSVSEQQATVHGDARAWPSPQDSLLIALADALHDTKTVDDTLWHALTQHYSDEQLIELVTLAGLYHSVSFVINAFGIEPEGFAPSFPAAS